MSIPVLPHSQGPFAIDWYFASQRPSSFPSPVQIQASLEASRAANTRTPSGRSLPPRDPKHSRRPSSATTKWRVETLSFFCPASNSQSRRKTHENRLAATKRLAKCLTHAQSHKNPQTVPRIPTFETMEKLTQGAENTDIFAYISICATDICSAAKRCHRSARSREADRELASHLRKKWRSCRKPDSRDSRVFLAWALRDELIQMFREVLADFGAFVVQPDESVWERGRVASVSAALAKVLRL